MNIPKISEEEFWQKIESRKYENREIIEWVENFFKKRRGYVFKFPDEGTPVVLLVSGGLDSIITWNILMEKYSLKVHPLFLDRGLRKTKSEKVALDFFKGYFGRKYPSLYISPKEYQTPQPPKYVKKTVKTHKLHPQYILNHYSQQGRSLGLTPGPYSYYGVTYALYLRRSKDLPIKTVFSGEVVGDGTVLPRQTFTVKRLQNLAICISTADYTWQYSSFAMEKELGHWLKKGDLIKIGNEMGIPLEKTWSCYSSKIIQCGYCLSCWSRRLEFSKAEVEDRTKYMISFNGELRKYIYLTTRYVFFIIKNIEDKILDLKKFLKGGE